MPIFKLYSEQSMGMSHYGDVMASGEGEIELTDEEVRLLVNLIKENGGETDVEELDLENKYPDIYEKLEEACEELASKVAWAHWVIEGYENSYYDYDIDEVMDNCESYGFRFDPEEHREEWGYEPDEDMDEDIIADARQDAFDKWLTDYRRKLSDIEDAEFLNEAFGIQPEDYDYSYDVVIPEEIIKMATVED